MPRAFLDRPIDLMPEWGQSCGLPPAVCGAFYARRKTKIQHRLSSLAAMPARAVSDEVALSCQRHRGRRCYGIDWNSLCVVEVLYSIVLNCVALAPF